MGLPRSTVFRDLLPENGFTDCSALVYQNLAPILGVLPTSAVGDELGGLETLLESGAAPGLFCVYGLSDRILVSGSGPNLAALAPLLGLPSMMALDEVVENPSKHGPEGLSSQS
jgi:hypothetical protein